MKIEALLNCIARAQLLARDQFTNGIIGRHEWAV